jgi:agmatine deiminase
MTTDAEQRRWRMPAEWEPHRATWISWPHFEPDWPGKLAPIPWVYAEIARVLAGYEQVDILCHDEEVRESARVVLAAHAVGDRVRLHLVPTDRVWMRDSAPTGVVDPAGAVSLLNWAFNGWAKYPNWLQDANVGRAIAGIAGLPRHEPQRPDTGGRIVLEGGGIDVNGRGLLMTTEEWLLSDTQVRNPGLSREDY